MFRKVSKIGPSTLMVSLPSKWVRKLGIQKGHELDITEEGNSLKVVYGRSDSGRVADVTATSDSILKRHLVTSYIAGCDEVRLTVEGAVDIELIESVLDSLLGYEIIEHTGNRYIIRDVAQSLNKEFDPVLRRIFLLDLSMGEESLGVLEKKNAVRQRMASLEKVNNKLANFCLRILNKCGYQDQKRVHLMISLVRELEKVADVYYDLCRYHTRAPQQRTLEHLKKANALFKEVYEMFYKPDLLKLEHAKMVREGLHDEMLNMMQRNHADSVLLHHLLSLLAVLAHIEYLLLYR